MLSLRIIHLNGTVVEKDIKLGSQQVNYCDSLLDYHLIRKNHILVTYLTNPDDFVTAEEWGMIIDFNGKEFGRISFGLTGQFVGSNIQLNINREKGFLRLYNPISSDNELEWQQYRIELDGTFTKLTSGKLDSFSSLYNRYEIISTVDEGYALVYVNTMNYFNATEPFLPQIGLFVLFIGYNQMPVSNLLLYQTTLQNADFYQLSCDILFVGVGQICTFRVEHNDPIKNL